MTEPTLGSHGAGLQIPFPGLPCRQVWSCDPRFGQPFLLRPLSPPSHLHPHLQLPGAMQFPHNSLPLFSPINQVPLSSLPSTPLTLGSQHLKNRALLIYACGCFPRLAFPLLSSLQGMVLCGNHQSGIEPHMEGALYIFVEGKPLRNADVVHHHGSHSVHTWEGP